MVKIRVEPDDLEGNPDLQIKEAKSEVFMLLSKTIWFIREERQKLTEDERTQIGFSKDDIKFAVLDSELYDAVDLLIKDRDVLI